MRLRHIVVPGVLMLSMALVSTAEAKLPAPKVTTIVPGKSVAGARLGMKLSVARKKWGAGSKCAAAAAGPGSIACTWSVTPNAQPDRSPKLILVSIRGRVRAITVDGGTGGRAIKAYRTKKRIGIGSTAAALRKAYPRLGSSLGPDNPSLGSGRTITSFYLKGGRVRSIQVGSPF